MHEPAPGTSRFEEDIPAQSANQGMGALLEEHESGYRRLRRGDVVDGVVVRIDRDEVLVDIGGKSEAVIPSSEIPAQEPSALEVGSEVVAYVLKAEDQEGHAVLSLSRAQAERGWRTLQKHFEDGDILEGAVLEANKGGLIVNVLGVRGFVPLSQIAEIRRGAAPEEGVEEKLRPLVGRTLSLKVIEMNRRRNRLILSERAAVQIRRAQEKERLLTELQPGEVRRGVVSSVCDFGAFIDLGGADGLVHLSELSWGPVGHPGAVVRVGQEVDVYVLSVDRDKKKIALSMKRLQAEPWSRVNELFEVGQMVDARITKLATFGAFARVGEGIEGLIHISELSDARITHPKQVVREGDQVQVRILRIDPERRRLGLSLRQGGFVYEISAEPTAAASGMDVAKEEVSGSDEPAAEDDSQATDVARPESEGEASEVADEQVTEPASEYEKQGIAN